MSSKVYLLVEDDVMNRKLFYANLDQFSKILLGNVTNLQAFLFHSKIYVEGIRKSAIDVEKHCRSGGEYWI